MSALSEILRRLNSSVTIPDHLLASLQEDELSALRMLESTIDSNRTWRVMSTKILEVSQMLNAGRASNDVLDAIVRHARSIIGAHIGYISLNDDESGFTNILATAGVVTEEFRNIRMPIGTGILGIVAATNRPAWTYDHAEDPEVSHVDYVDEAVEAEGIRGILGAPIRISGKTVGALLVGDRHPRHYTRDEIMAIELLGAMTAVALDTARVIESQGESVAKLSRSQLELRTHVEELHKLADADSRLLAVLIGDARFEELAEVLSEFLGVQVELWLEESSTFVGDGTRDEWTDAIAAARKHNNTRSVDNRSVLPVEFHGRFLGAICVPKGINDVELRVVGHASAAFAAIALFNEALVDATARKVDDLVYSVAVGTAGNEEALRLKRLTGIDLAQPESLYFLGVNCADPALSRMRLDGLLDGASAVTRHEQHYCVLFQPDRDVATSVRRLVAESSAPVFVAAAPVAGVTEAHEAHDSAMAYLDAAITLGMSGELVTEDTLGAVGLILRADPSALAALVRRSVGALVEYDAAHDTELEATAYQFFLSGHSIPGTARELYLHVNTVRQRLERISRVLGEDWATGERSLDTQLALRIRALARGRSHTGV